MRYFFYLNDFLKEDILYLVEFVSRFKKEVKRGFYFLYLKNKVLGLIFIKVLIRMCVLFEVGIY